MMVAIGIITVLGSLLLPVWGKVQKKSQDVTCLANLRSWGGVLQSFISDNDGRYRNWYSGTRTHPDPAQYWTWYAVSPLGHTAAELQRSRCPLGPGKPTDLTAVHYGFYAADSHGSVVTNPGGSHYEIRFNTHPSPSKAILLADSLTSAGVPVHTIFPPNLISRGGIHAPHGNNANLYFADGHVESASPERLNELGVTKYYNKEGEAKDTPKAKAK